MAKILTDSKIGNDQILTTKTIIDQGPSAFKYYEFPLNVIYKGNNEIGEKEEDGYDKFNGPENYTMFGTLSPVGGYGQERTSKYSYGGGFYADHRELSSMSKVELYQVENSLPVLFGYTTIPFNFKIQGFYFYADKIRWDMPMDEETWGSSFVIEEYVLKQNGINILRATQQNYDIENPGTTVDYHSKFIEITCDEYVSSGDLLELTFITNSELARFSGVSMGIWGEKSNG